MKHKYINENIFIKSKFENPKDNRLISQEVLVSYLS